ncbi:hypothetical protein PGB28_21105 [Primorskyibacter aestuariivivens]|nr:hypothetical protein [Primorskyibacter aestuariivivens]MDA7430961.1 hypothetical protein [Primorskyibacter aestuariivivens]
MDDDSCTTGTDANGSLIGPGKSQGSMAEGDGDVILSGTAHQSM